MEVHLAFCSHFTASSGWLHYVGLGLLLVSRAFCQSELDSFAPDVDGIVYSMALQPDGKIIIGGDFGAVNGTNIAHLARLNPDGSLDLSFNPQAGDQVDSIAVQADGKIVVGGYFVSLGGQPRSGIGRLNPDGGLDTSFHPEANYAVWCLAIQPDGRILVGGEFTVVGGKARSRLARINADGSLDADFDPMAGGVVYSLALQADGKILVGGDFYDLSDVSGCASIGRLNDDGRSDLTFCPPTEQDDEVHILIVQPDGKILVGGLFNGLNAYGLGRLNVDGSLDREFTPATSYHDGVLSLAVQTDGKILVAGWFTMMGGQPRNQVARLNRDGSLDSSFDAGIVEPSEAERVAVQTDGRILVAGFFTALGGQMRNHIGRFSSPTPAVQALAVNPSGTIATWKRGGSAPEVEQVTFEMSNDAAIYTTLGDGTRVPGGWQITGLSLPGGHRFYIRARGRIGGSLIESVGKFPAPQLTGVAVLGSGAFTFYFTNLLASATDFNVLATTNPSLPAPFWDVLGAPAPVGNDRFQFFDLAATNFSRRFYQLRWP